MASSDLTIRIAAGADSAALADLRARWATGREAPPTLEGEIRAWLAAEGEHRTVWLAEAGGEPVGMVSLLEYRRMPRPDVDDGRWGYVGQLFVLAAHRRRGVGSALLDVVLARAEARGHVRLVTSPSEEGRALFARFGFASGREGPDGLVVRAGP